MAKKKLDRKMLKYFSRMAAEAYVNDPVHVRATKNENKRKRYVYHFMMERLSTSNREDIIYLDEQNRGICIWRRADNNYNFFDFMRCSHWVFLALYLPNTVKTLLTYNYLDGTAFPENTLLISPVFVSPEHQGKGIATKLIKKGISDLEKQGYNFGLETQNPENVHLYEKLGFKVIRHDYIEKIGIHNFFMLYSKE